MGGGTGRDRLVAGPVARVGETAHQAGETGAVYGTEVQQRRIAGAHRARDHVTGRELVYESLAPIVADQCRRMELNELEVGDSGARAIGHPDPVAARARRICRLLPERGSTAGCKE